MLDLHYDVHAGTGPPLLLVHGFLSSRAQWHSNLEALGEVCTPVTVELYGHGRSPTPVQADAYLPANYLLQFDAIRRAIGVEKWFLCGYSLGAGLTIRYAFEYPQHTFAHIFTNSSSAFSPRPEERAAADVVKHFKEGGIEIIEKIPVHPRYARRLPEEIKQMLVEDARLISPVAIGRNIAYTNATVSIRDELKRNTRPALLVCGKEEKRFQVHRDFIKANMPETSLVDLPAGHAVNMECPEQFNQAVTDFIQQNS
ncbi:MAG: alpha/beta fold hydrolase [bacterium]|nr:alpha/beta fold hydrolase [Gammaproteobacteria bacterium]